MTLVSRPVIPHAVILVPRDEPFEKSCSFCKTPLPQLYFDAQTLSGRWADLCPNCFWSFGRTLGLGQGQLFIRVDSKEVLKPI